MRRSVDILVIGTGIAGLSAAIEGREAGLNIMVITKADKIEETNTNYAQGGIIAARDGDTAELLAKDLYRAGCGYNSRAAVELLSSEGPGLAHEFLINKVGVEFSRNRQGEYDYTEEAAHSSRRILHYEDHTGDSIQAGLIAYAQKIGVEIHTSCTAIDLITNNHHSTDCQELYKEREVLGAYVYDETRQCVCTWFAQAVILASGGLGNLYQYTTNPPEATGDGISMAYRAGADIINAEFVQFHPTALFHKDIRRFLISESLRGEGAKLINKDGEPFMRNYSELGDLAPRDVVTRAIYEEMAREGSKYMRLDLASYYKGEKPIEERFSRIYSTCLSGGLDITKEPIPITPAAHYFVGGIKVDGDGRTSLKRLYAAGEVSCTGLHGANRLASTSLLEGLVWGVRAARHIKASFRPIQLERLDAIPDWQLPQKPESFEPLMIYQDWNIIKMTMWNHVGIIRTRRGLERASADLNYHAHRINKFYKEASLSRDIIELRNGVVTAQIVIAAAMHNSRSIGCHFRLD